MPDDSESQSRRRQLLDELETRDDVDHPHGRADASQHERQRHGKVHRRVERFEGRQVLGRLAADHRRGTAQERPPGVPGRLPLSRVVAAAMVGLILDELVGEPGPRPDAELDLLATVIENTR